MDEEQPKKPKSRGRPPGKHRASHVKPVEQELTYQSTVKGREKKVRETLSSPPLTMEDDQEKDQGTESSHPTAFSQLLRHIIGKEHADVEQVAKAVAVSENTVYRWLNGSTEPRAQSLKKLLEVLPEQHRQNLSGALSQTYRLMADSVSLVGGLSETPKEIYRRVLALAATSEDEDNRRWHIMQALFDYALLQLDAERRGLALTYAQLMPPREDGIRSLYEFEMRGNFPWPHALDGRAYLGSTTLAGVTATTQRMQIWNKQDTAAKERVLYMIDEYEKSACAAPVMRAGRIAGVLIVSSTQEDFFTRETNCLSVVEYANLLAVGMKECDFVPCSLVNLIPMPDLAWQREEIRRSYSNRVINCARKLRLSLPEAEAQVRKDMEEEFAQHVAKVPSLEDLLGKESRDTFML